MAIISKVNVPGGTTAQYDRVNEVLARNGQIDAPDGLIQHICGVTGDGLVVVDVWDSEASLQRFGETLLGPALQEVGVPASAPEISQVHNMIPQGAGGNPNVIMTIDFPAPPEVYDAMAASMPSHAGDVTQGPWVSHVAGVKDDGTMVIVDLWDSPEAFERFAQAEIVPVAGDRASEIQPQFIPVHNVILARATVGA